MWSILFTKQARSRLSAVMLLNLAYGRLGVIDVFFVQRKKGYFSYRALSYAVLVCCMVRGNAREIERKREIAPTRVNGFITLVSRFVSLPPARDGGWGLSHPFIFAFLFVL